VRRKEGDDSGAGDGGAFREVEMCEADGGGEGLEDRRGDAGVC